MSKKAKSLTRTRVEWVISNGIICGLAYMAVNGSIGAGRLLPFIVWPLGLLMLAALLIPEAMKAMRKEVAKHGRRPIPGVICHAVGFGLIGYLVWHGWAWTAVPLLINEIAVASAYKEAWGESGQD